ncbi:MAG: hypothetical protein LBL49_00435 [Clostridiales Family XIII bacterium]|jgi:hypothetical protein|nr:hypothetical protein [Clostridiales Family XIII bacterium]
MRVDGRNSYMSNREWFHSVLRDNDVVLCHTSALECLGQFPGYANESQIDVYAMVREPYDNINWYVIDGFDGLDIVNIAGLRCTSFNQTVNDMLRDYDLIDEQSLVQALAGFYYRNGESFNGLRITPQYADRFNAIRDWAIEFYDYE